MIISLYLKKTITIPLEFDNVLPEKLYNKSLTQIGNTIIYQGNKELKLKDFFTIDVVGLTNNSNDCKIIINGNLSRIKYIGNKMSSGIIIANGDVDLHVGSQMSGGKIVVNGNAESYAGREMSGGLLKINGNVKEFCGSSYSGEWRGMTGGKIIINGNAGKQLADFMIKGVIHITGSCDILPGVHMAGGFIQIDGDVDKWPAGAMKKGTIIINGKVKEILPTFILEETVTNPLINNKYFIGKYNHYIGDIASNGKGHLWIKQ